MSISPKQSPVTSVNILSLQGNIRKLNDDITFLVALGGEIMVQLKSEIVYLFQGDILLVQPEEYPVYSASGNNLVLVISIKKEFFIKNSAFSSGHFVCNSSKDPNRNYSALKRILAQIAIAHFEHTRLGDLHQMELSYSLLYYLSCYHYEENTQGAVSSTSSDRESIILNYLEQNYMNTVTLNDLAALTHLNTSYLSRFFKKTTGDTLNSCLQTIRLKHALADLTGTNNSITNIAYENGFPSPAAFCKAFSAYYRKTPSEYRKSAEPTSNPSPTSQQATQVDYLAVESELQAMASFSSNETPKHINYPVQSSFIVEDVKMGKPVTPIWNQLINLGFCTNIINSGFQNQLKMVQNEIGFQYGRVEGLLNDEILPLLQSGGYNFSEADRIIQVMQSLNIKPFIDLSIRSDNVYLAEHGSVIYRHDELEKPQSAYGDKAEAFIKHCINTYGIDEVNTWIFDLGIFHNEFLDILETPKEFATRTKRIWKLIKELLPDALVGGITYNVGMKDSILYDTLKEMAAANFKPDFISVCIFPYEKSESLATTTRLLVSDESHPLHAVKAVKRILSGFPEMTQKIYVVALGPSFQTNDYINDTCFQATYFIKNTIDLLGLVEAAGYWKLSDIADEYTDSSRILFGSAGIISRNGLKKPGFTALKRLNFLYTRLIKKEPGFLAMTNGINTYNLVLYNYSHFNEVYCVSGARGFNEDTVYSAFSEQTTKDVSVTLKGLEDGRYKVVITTLNREHGSLFDDWIRFGIMDNLQPKDIQYLADTVHPQRLASFIECTDNTLSIRTQLLPHEVKFYEIIREL